MKPTPMISFSSDTPATSVTREYAAYILNSYRHHYLYHRAERSGNVYTFKPVDVYGCTLTITAGPTVRTLEQLFTYRTKHGSTSIWLPVTHHLSGEWLQTRLVHKAIAGCTVRVK